MSTTLIGFGVATLAAVGLVITLGVLSLLSGGVHFFLAKPRLSILKSQNGETGFAFGLKWNASMEPVGFDTIKVRLFNPFGSPSQVEVSHTFDAKKSDFGADVDMGPGMKRLIEANQGENARVMVEVGSSKDGVFHQYDMRADSFMKKMNSALESADHFDEENQEATKRPLYHQNTRSFIAEPLPTSNKTLKIASNPEFAGEFAGAAGASEAPKENFAVSKVWIEPGCIVCNACEGIFPEVFEVTDDTCLIRPGAPLDDGLKILEAAEACPVEIIKFDRA